MNRSEPKVFTKIDFCLDLSMGVKDDLLTYFGEIISNKDEMLETRILS